MPKERINIINTLNSMTMSNKRAGIELSVNTIITLVLILVVIVIVLFIMNDALRSIAADILAKLKNVLAFWETSEVNP